MESFIKENGKKLKLLSKSSKSIKIIQTLLKNSSANAELCKL